MHLYTDVCAIKLNRYSLNLNLCIGYIWKDKSEDGVRKILSDNIVPLDKLLVETDAPFMYPNTRSAKLPADVKPVITQRLYESCLSI